MIAEIVAGVLIALALARVLAVAVRRLWEPVAYSIVASWPKDRTLPKWFFVTSELVTNERWDDR